ncbi:MAG: glycosyltransferase family 39 protein [Phycisphaerales bacterium]|nr:glycosyltransferase family 39 protein [Phycisphaerales bacterium]
MGWPPQSSTPTAPRHALRGRVDRAEYWPAAAIALLVLAQVAFLALDRRTFSYDDSWYAETSLRLLDALARGGVPEAWMQFIERSLGGIKAPLVVALPLPLLLVLGRHDYVFPLTNLLCFAVAAAYLAALLRRYVGPLATAAAVLALGLMPLTNLTIRQFFVEIPLAALLVMAVYHLDRSEQFTRAGHAALAGLAIGLAVLAKVTTPVFLVGILFLEYVRLARRDAGWLPPLAGVAIGLAAPALGVVLAVFRIPHALPIALAVTALLLAWRLALRPGPVSNVASMTALAAWVPLPWYLHNWNTITEYAVSNSVGEISRYYGAAELLSAAAMANFWLANINVGFGVVWLGGTLLCLVMAGLTSLATERGRRVRQTAPPLVSPGGGLASSLPSGGFSTPHPHREGAGGGSQPPATAGRIALTALAWILPAVIAFTLGRNRTTRFIMPLLPALAIFSALLFETLLRRVRPVGVALITLQLVAAAFVWAVFSFGGPELRAGPRSELVLCSPRMTERGPLTRLSYPLGEIVAAAAQVAPRDLGRDALGMLLTDTIHVNQNTLSYAAVKAGAPMMFGLVPYGVSLEYARGDLARADFLLYQVGGRDYPDFTNQHGPTLLGEILAGELAGWQPLSQPVIPLPDGGMVRFIRRAPLADSGDGPPLTPCLVLFGGGSYALVAWSLAIDERGLTIATVWVKLRADRGNYAVAAHVLGPSRGERFNADHHLVGGPAALATLAVGQSAVGYHTLARGEWSERAAGLELALYDLDAQRNVPCEARHGPPAREDGWISLPLPAQR